MGREALKRLPDLVCCYWRAASSAASGGAGRWRRYGAATNTTSAEAGPDVMGSLFRKALVCLTLLLALTAGGCATYGPPPIDTESGKTGGKM